MPLIRLQHRSRHDLSAHQRHVDEARRLAIHKGGQRIHDGEARHPPCVGDQIQIQVGGRNDGSGCRGNDGCR
ncbi:MAG: hypothetical protein DMF95_07580 [Acidobacteria bacterium]|nr:MAG: hypothetical protein DMF95_07580 [Acidobacteriota bacterium]